MTQEEKISIIKTAVAHYYKKQPEVINVIRKSDPDFIMRWLCCYFLKFEIGLKLREIAAAVYNTDDPSNIPGYLEKLRMKIMREQRVRIAIGEIRKSIEQSFKSIAA